MIMKRIVALLSAAAMALSTLGIPAAASGSGEKPIADMVSAMTTKQKVEQMIMITFRPWEGQNVTALNEQQRKLIEDHNFAGVCLFAANIQSVEQTVALTTEIQQAAMNSECGIPMLISADQEGGSIYRLTTGTPTCGNMALGATNDPSLAEENAKILGSEIMSLGINTDFAPVVDVNNNPSNPVINIRSFSSDPNLVSQMGTSYIKGLQSEGVITTCKHFPGHGDTGVDSHTGLPLIDKSYDELKKLELVPYATVCKETDMIMTAHIQFPQIETETYTSKSTGEKISLPATLSKTMITDVLRGDYGFDGVVTTDAMLMSAIDVNFDPIDAATFAINADVDIILEPVFIQSPDDITEIEQYIDDVVKLVEDGKVSIETIDKSVTRILTMKQKRGVLDYKAPSAENAKKIVGSAEHREKALETAEKAVTLVKNDDNLLPLKLEDGSKVAYFYPYSNVKNTIYFALDRLKEEGVVPESVTTDCICLQGHTADEFEENIKSCDVVILAYEMYSAANLDKTNEARGWQAKFADDLIKLAHANGKKVVYLSANIPYDVARFQSADAIVAAYNADGMDELPVDGKENSAYGVNYPAALITIFGGNSPTGKLPVDVYGVDNNSQYTDKILYPLGYGLGYKTDLKAAIKKLSELSETINGDEIYEDMYESLAEALREAQTVADNEKATVDEVAEQTELLKEMIEHFDEAKKLVRDFEIANKVAIMINELPEPNDVDKPDKEAIEAARAAFEALTDNQKKIITQSDLYQKLIDDEKALADALKRIDTTRLAGADRFATAVEISKASFEKADTVVLSYGLKYADALAGVPLASKLNAPILLTDKDKLNAETLAEIKRLNAKNVIILGGEGAISNAVKKTLEKNGLKNERIAGKTRFSTATAIAERVNENPTDVIFVYGLGYADAVSVSSVAALKNAPIIYLTTDGELNADTAAYLAKLKAKGCVKNAYVIGGKGVISDDMLNKAGDALGITPTRVAGKDRYETGALVNKTFADVFTSDTVCVATGVKFPDALAGGVFAAQQKAPLLLVNDTLKDVQKTYLTEKNAHTFYVYGGTGAVPNKLVEEITALSK